MKYNETHCSLFSEDKVPESVDESESEKKRIRKKSINQSINRNQKESVLKVFAET